MITPKFTTTWIETSTSVNTTNTLNLQAWKTQIWVKNSVNSTINPEILTKATIEECKQIESWIKEENKIHKHMVEKTAEELFEEINNWPWYIAKMNWKVIACMCMIEIKMKDSSKIYEAWSLIVDTNLQWKWIGKHMATHLFEDNSDKPVYSITEVPKVKTIYIKDLWLKMVTKEDLLKTEKWIEVLADIEAIAPLLPTDEIYWNQKFLELIWYKND